MFVVSDQTATGRVLEKLECPPLFPRDRVLHLSWKGPDLEWLLVEDARTTESIRQEALAQQG